MSNNRPTWKPLRGYGAFTRVLTHGKAFTSGSVRCFVHPRKSAAEFVIGFGITRQVRGSVKRNRIRRLLKESVRHHQHIIVGHREQEAPAGEIVLMYVGQTPERPSRIRLADLENSVAQLLRSAIAYCEAGNRRAGRTAD